MDEAEIEDLENLLLQEEEISHLVDTTTSLKSQTKQSTTSDAVTERIARNNEIIQKMLLSKDLDSSSDDDDGEGKNHLLEKYNDYGKNINQNLKFNQLQKKEKFIDHEITNINASSSTNELSRNFLQKPIVSNVPVLKADKTDENKNIYIDPIFGMRISRPLISSQLLKERMTGRIAVPFFKLRNFIETSDLNSDWVIAGVLVSKTAIKTSQNGNQYCIWKMSDLRGDIKTISVFLFRSAYKDLWKTQDGTIVAVLNPKVFDKKPGNSGDEVTLSIDTSQKVMILGMSKDLGKCRSKKKNGDACNAIVNINNCEYCIYHVKQEYNNASNRSGFKQVSTRGLDDLRNKVLGKNEVFYGGQIFTAVRAVKNPKQMAKDQDRLTKLSDYYQSPFQGTQIGVKTPKSKEPVPYATVKRTEVQAAKVEGSVKQRHKDLERLAMLKGTNLNTSTDSSDIDKCGAANQLALLSTIKRPQLRREGFSLEISSPKTEKEIEANRLKALAILKKKPLEKSNPNFIKHRGTDQGKKRALDEMIKSSEAIELNKASEDGGQTKKQKLDAERDERLKRIMEATSSHQTLLTDKELEAEEKYFSKLEKKEAMEEKMLNTFKVECKAVICRICKYMAFSASDMCKAEKHPLRVVDAEKRFFKCQDCGNRTVTLYRIPKITCKNCNSSRWERTAMMRERNMNVGEKLSIRGDEESFIGSMQINGGNVNLLVPE